MTKNLEVFPTAKRQTAETFGSILDDQSRRSMQEVITVSLIAFLGTIFVFLFIGIVLGIQSGRAEVFAQLKELLNLVLGPLVTLLSTVVGFYFGAKIGRPGDGAGAGEAGAGEAE